MQQRCAPLQHLRRRSQCATHRHCDAPGSISTQTSASMATGELAAWRSAFSAHIADLPKVLGNGAPYDRAAARLRQLVKSGLLPLTAVRDEPDKFFAAHRMLSEFATALGPGFGIRFTVQFNLAAGTVTALGSPEQLQELSRMQVGVARVAARSSLLHVCMGRRHECMQCPGLTGVAGLLEWACCTPTAGTTSQVQRGWPATPKWTCCTSHACLAHQRVHIQARPATHHFRCSTQALRACQLLPCLLAAAARCIAQLLRTPLPALGSRPCLPASATPAGPAAASATAPACSTSPFQPAQQVLSPA